jgi:hypothetical protein
MNIYAKTILRIKAERNNNGIKFDFKLVDELQLSVLQHDVRKPRPNKFNDFSTHED